MGLGCRDPDHSMNNPDRVHRLVQAGWEVPMQAQLLSTPGRLLHRAGVTEGNSFFARIITSTKRAGSGLYRSLWLT